MPVHTAAKGEKDDARCIMHDLTSLKWPPEESLSVILHPVLSSRERWVTQLTSLW
jgi:hypothetical protein